MNNRAVLMQVTVASIALFADWWHPGPCCETDARWPVNQLSGKYPVAQALHCLADAFFQFIYRWARV